MIQEQWTAVAHHLTDLLAPSDPALDEALAAAEAAGLPPINVSPTEGKLLHLLARTRGARTILEVGTLAGYSTIWLARALPRGRRQGRWGGRAAPGGGGRGAGGPRHGDPDRRRQGLRRLRDRARHRRRAGRRRSLTRRSGSSRARPPSRPSCGRRSWTAGSRSRTRAAPWASRFRRSARTTSTRRSTGS